MTHDAITITIPKDVAKTKFGSTTLLTMLKRMGAEVVEETSLTIVVPDGVEEVFNYYVEVLGANFPRGVKLDAERKRVIAARLRNYSVADLKLVIDYVSRSKFHLGDNDRNKKYLSFNNIMGNNRKVDDKLNEMHDKGSLSPAMDEARLTLRTIGAKIRSGTDGYSDKDKLAKVNKQLFLATGERYSIQDDTFIRGE